MQSHRRTSIRAELAVFVAGVASMGFEILAGRLVAPAFGSSVSTWGGVIGVFLTALSAGYALGGRTAADRASTRTLAVVLAATAVMGSLIAVGGESVVAMTDALPIPDRYGVVAPATVLFGPLTFLLGLVSPYAAELSRASTHGEASGRVYALGTVGSIVGVFGTTFVLIPWLSVQAVALVLGGLLVVGAVVAVWPPVESAGTVDGTAAVAVAAVVVVGTAGVTAVGVPQPAGVVHEEETAYSHLEIIDDRGVRTMYLDGVPQSATYVDDREGYVFEYSRYTHIPMLLAEDVDRVLVIGGGGFSTPKRYVAEYPDVTVDVVELDPAVVDAAKRYFGVEESERLRIHTMDGRSYLEETTHTYDVIILDAFRKDKVPFHLTTREFMSLARSKLDDDGVLMANVISTRRGDGSAFYRAMVETMNRTYGQVYVFPTADTAALLNIELVATKNATLVTEAELQRRNDRRRVGLNLSAEISHYRHASTVPTDDVPVLTDDYAPVDRLLDEQAGKRYVIQRNHTTSPALAPP